AGRGGRRRHRLRHHALLGGGRVLRPGVPHRGRTADRRRLAGRAAGASVRRLPDRRDGAAGGARPGARAAGRARRRRHRDARRRHPRPARSRPSGARSAGRHRPHRRGRRRAHQGDADDGGLPSRARDRGAAGMSARRLLTLIRREVRATFRDTFTVTILITVPLVALLAFSFSLSTEVHGLRLAVLDADGSAESRRLVEGIAASKWFVPVSLPSRDAIDRGLRGGTVSAALIIPPDFSRTLRQRREPPEVQLLYDGAEALLAGNAEGALGGLVNASGARLVRDQSPAGGGSVVSAVLFNPRLDGTPYMVAGVFGFVLSFLTTLITAVTIVNERQSGTFDQLQVTPATALEILLGKLLPLGAIFALDVVLMMLVAGFAFGVWPAGSALFFLLVSSFYLLVSLSLGLIFSATSSTPAEAVRRTVLFTVPLVQLSGFSFPIVNMPAVLRWLALAFPATHYIRVSRGIYLRGEGPLTLLPELLVLGLFAAVLVVLALRTLEARE